jgi:membrane-bound ClpP family serine protease
MDMTTLGGLGLIALIISSVTLNKKIKEKKKSSWKFLSLFIISSLILSIILSLIALFMFGLEPETAGQLAWVFQVFTSWIMEFVFSKFIL